MDAKKAFEISVIGDRFQKIGDIEKALSCFRQAIELHPDCYRYYYKLGNILREQGKPARAESYYRQAIQLHTQDPWCYYFLGEVLREQNQLETAMDCYSQAIALNPDCFWFYYSLGRIFHQKERLVSAIDCYQKALESNSEYFWAHHFLGEVFYQQGELTKALRSFQRAIEIDKSFYGSHYQIGNILQTQNLAKEAIDYYLKAIALKPKHFWSHYHLGRTYWKLEEYDRAIEFYQQAIELNPKFLQPYFCLGQAILTLGTEYLNDYLDSIAHKSQLFQVYFNLGLGQAWEKQGNFHRAIDCYLVALKLDCDRELPYQLLQYVEIPPDKRRELIAFYRQLTAKKPNLPLAWNNLGDILTEANKVRSAIICYQSSWQTEKQSKTPILKRSENHKPTIVPSFLIIGAAKCGTTSLFNYLKDSPQILLPQKKEINFFNRHFSCGLAWYLAHFPPVKQGEKIITGEATTQYIFTHKVAHRVARTLGKDLKIIIMLRNPVERTISDYFHHFNRGLETQSISTIIDKSQKKLSQLSSQKGNHKISDRDYVLKSIYYYQVYPWQELFGKKNILIIDSDRFFQKTGKVMDEVSNFLEVTPWISENYIRHNVGIYQKIDRELELKLQNLFQPFNQSLEDYLGHKYNW